MLFSCLAVRNCLCWVERLAFISCQSSLGASITQNSAFEHISCQSILGASNTQDGVFEPGMGHTDF